MSRSARCGKCHTCLNPHLKKACLQRRHEQLAKLDASGEIPLLLLPQYQTMTAGRLPNGHAAPAGPGAGSGAGSGSPLAAAAAPPPPKRHKARPDYAELDAGGAAPGPDSRPRAKPSAAAAAGPAPAPGGDPFSRELQQIVGRRGGLESARFAPRLIRLMGLPGMAGDMRRVLLHIGARLRPLGL